MRTTLQIDDDVLEAAREIATRDGRGLGAVLSELARRSLQPPSAKRGRGFPMFDVEPTAVPITAGDVARALDED